MRHVRAPSDSRRRAVLAAALGVLLAATSLLIGVGQPVRAVAALALALLLPGNLWSYVIVPRVSEPGVRLVITIGSSLLITIALGTFLGALQALSVTGAVVGWLVVSASATLVALWPPRVSPREKKDD